MQVTQGFDLLPYAGKTVMRYTYPILNYPGEAEEVYASLYVQDGEVIGGTVFSTADSSLVHGLLYERTDG